MAEVQMCYIPLKHWSLLGTTLQNEGNKTAPWVLSFKKQITSKCHGLHVVLQVYMKCRHKQIAFRDSK